MRSWKLFWRNSLRWNAIPQHHVLCSYFIKTFLFWKYEATELYFWRADNFKECIKYLLSEFSKCIQEGLLRHYFIPRFNLLSVKLTRAAQTELLQLFDIIIQSDISILRECRTVRNVWSQFLQVHQDKINVLPSLKRKNLLRKDECAMSIIKLLSRNIAQICKVKHVIRNDTICQTVARFSCKRPLMTLAMRKLIFEKHIDSTKPTSYQGNKGMYQIYRTANNDTYSFDISTCKLRCAILLYMKGSFLETLDIINAVLSSIPPFAMYMNGRGICASHEVKELYVNMFLDSGVQMFQRARKAWMFDLCITHDMTNMVPLAIQIEFFFRTYHAKDVTVLLSPFTCAYYLQFLCYHNMHQYNNRDHALQELIDIVNDKYQNRIGHPQVSLNITGHCLLLAGRRDQALVMFQMSYRSTKDMHPSIHKANSATWYLKNCF